MDDGPAEISPEKLAAVPDAVPVPEKIIRATTRPYVALGNRYEPHLRARPYKERGDASWYGRRYHGRKTASGEVYDMFKMTAAHPVLPIPSYARVTRPDSGKSVVVRINDRGPFLKGRVIDLSYVAAHRLDLIRRGSGEVIVEAVIFPEGDAAAEKPAERRRLYIQLGAFRVLENAEKSLRGFAAEFPDIGGKIYFRDGLHLVLAGPYPGESAAESAEEGLCAAGWCGFLTGAP